jgi:hypothetical protein
MEGKKFNLKSNEASRIAIQNTNTLLELLPEMGKDEIQGDVRYFMQLEPNFQNGIIKYINDKKSENMPADKLVKLVCELIYGSYDLDLMSVPSDKKYKLPQQQNDSDAREYAEKFTEGFFEELGEKDPDKE